MGDAKRNPPPIVIVLMLLVVIGIPFLPLLITRRWDWWEAWVYAAVFILGFLLSRGLAARQHPDLLAERARFIQQPGTKPWDKALAPLMAFGAAFLALAAGLDSRAGATLDVGVGGRIAALAVIVAGYALGTYALVANRFFSGTVRIQTDRGHRVVTAGPYRWLRHPGYAGALAFYVATPFFLASRWALLPAALLVVVTFVRTALEDRTLQGELSGYREYAQRVRHRLIPGVW